MIASILSIVGMVGVGIWMFRKGRDAGYTEGYRDGAIDGFSVKR